MNVRQHLLCPDSPSVLQINLQALAQNYLMLDSLVEGAETASVVKADGYGLGAVCVVQALIDKGCRTFFVAHLSEAVPLRKSFPDIKIYVLNGLITGKEEDFLAFHLIPVLNNLHDIEVWKAFAHRKETELAAAIHFDTGMNRLGLGTRETTVFLENQKDLLSGLKFDLAMSHFSCADEKGCEETAQQANKFKHLINSLGGVRASLCNSAGIFSSPDDCYDLVRPGMALYGLNPTPYKENPMQQVVSLKTRILNIQTIRKGETVGYGATYRAEKDEKVATVSLGYADGFFRGLGEKAALYWQEQKCPFRGRVSMDLATVSIDHIKEGAPNIGDMMDVICAEQTPADLAGLMPGGTIDYEVLTSLGARYKKVYIN